MTEQELKEKGLNGRTEYMANKDRVYDGSEYYENIHNGVNIQCAWCGIKGEVREQGMLVGDKAIFDGIEISCYYCTCDHWEEFNPNEKEKQNINPDDICKSCGSVGEVRLMSCICKQCNNVIWGI